VYRRIADDLRTRIERGEYPPGSRLPTKAQLMEEYGVAVNTVERAIGVLRREGLVETVQGAGMFVRETPPDRTTSSPTADQRLSELESEVATLRGAVDELRALIRERTGN